MKQTKIGEQTNQEQQSEAWELMAQFKAIGYSIIWGGGDCKPDPNGKVLHNANRFKGHGYWIQKPDGQSMGGCIPHREAVALLETLPEVAK